MSGGNRANRVDCQPGAPSLSASSADRTGVREEEWRRLKPNRDSITHLTQDLRPGLVSVPPFGLDPSRISCSSEFSRFQEAADPSTPLRCARDDKSERRTDAGHASVVHRICGQDGSTRGTVSPADCTQTSGKAALAQGPAHEAGSRSIVPAYPRTSSWAELSRPA